MDKNYHKRRRQWKAVNRARARFVRQIKRLWRRAIRDYIDGTDPLAIAEAMRITYVEVGGQFARSQYKKIVGKKALGDINDPFDELMEQYARTELGTITASIQDTISNMSATIFADEILTNDEKIKAIDKLIIARSKLITENEITRASNIGTEIGAAEAVAIEASRYTKTWIATIDAVVRDAHEAADGQTVFGHEDFSVGDEALKFPGDPNGSVWNTIRCRCVVDYLKVDS